VRDKDHYYVQHRWSPELKGVRDIFHHEPHDLPKLGAPVLNGIDALLTLTGLLKNPGGSETLSRICVEILLRPLERVHSISRLGQQ
jgi:hypothetical protein